MMAHTLFIDWMAQYNKHIRSPKIDLWVQCNSVFFTNAEIFVLLILRSIRDLQ